MSVNKVLYAIECEDVNFHTVVQAKSHKEMVEGLMEKGFNRMLKDCVPIQEEGEPLAFLDNRDREWSAMPYIVHGVHEMKDIREFADHYKGEASDA